MPEVVVSAKGSYKHWNAAGSEEKDVNREFDVQALGERVCGRVGLRLPVARPKPSCSCRNGTLDPLCGQPRSVIVRLDENLHNLPYCTMPESSLHSHDENNCPL